MTRTLLWIVALIVAVNVALWLAPWAWAIALVLWGLVLLWILAEAKLLPEALMRILDRLTNRGRLKDALADMARETRRIDVDDMRRFLGERVIGQDVVVDQVARGIARRMAMRRRGKPVFVCLISGPTGTGKTELAKAVAEYLFKGAMFRVDCGQMAAHGISSLIGSPKGYVGSGDYGSLTKHLKTQPESIILFDEVEKAATAPDAPLNKLLLSLLDEGRVQEQSDNSTHDATGAIIFMTSNANARELGTLAERYRDQPDELVRATKDSLQNFFAPELLGRIDLVTTVAPLTDEAKAAICCLHLVKLADNYGLNLVHVDVELLVEAVRTSKTLAGYGTRELVRWLEGAAGDAMIQAADRKLKDVRVQFDGEAVAVVPA